eukprot:m.19967 g.19967  ORF g.19967 m.19967 type:complete len:536 (-) comp8529_c0_seq1:80-1687(-)
MSTANRRMKAFKNAAKNDIRALRSARHNQIVELRKDRRKQDLMKRRNIMREDETDNDIENEMNNTIGEGKDLSTDVLPQLAQILFHGTDGDKVLEATKKCRQLVAKDKYAKDTVKYLVENGVVPRIVEFLAIDHGDIQYEAAWTLTNVASGDSEDTMTVVAAGAVQPLIELLSNETEKIREQAVWCLGNIAGDGPELRDLTIGAGILQPLLYIVNNSSTTLSMMKNATWVLSNLCRGKRPEPNFELVSEIIPTFVDLVQHEDNEIAADAAWGLSYLSDGEEYKVQTVIDTGVVEHLKHLLARGVSRVVTPAIRCIGNICTGSAEQTQVPVDVGCLPLLSHQLQVGKENVRKEACWAISNITAGTTEQVTAVIESNAVPALIHNLAHGEYRTRKEACWALSNLTNHGTQEDIRYLIQQGCIAPFVGMLKVQDTKIIEISLDALKNVLVASEMGDGSNPACDWIDEAGGVDIIEALQEHEDEKVYNVALSIIEEFFCDEEEDNVFEPEQSGNTFHFGLSEEQHQHPSQAMNDDLFDI